MQQKMPLFGLLLAALHFAALTLADGAQAQATKQAASEKPSTPQVVQPAELGNTKNVHRIGNLFVAGQFGPDDVERIKSCLLYTSPSPRDQRGSRMPSSA